MSDFTVCILDRPRHAKLIDDVRTAGAAIHLIGDGDIAGIIQTVEAADTGIDIYIGIGGAPEGVLAAAALRCIGGQMQGRLTALSEEERKRAVAMGLIDLSPKYSIELHGDGRCHLRRDRRHRWLVARRREVLHGRIETHTVIMRAATKTVRWLRTQHRAAASVFALRGVRCATSRLLKRFFGLYGWPPGASLRTRSMLSISLQLGHRAHFAGL